MTAQGGGMVREKEKWWDSSEDWNGLNLLEENVGSSTTGHWTQQRWKSSEVVTDNQRSQNISCER